MRMRWTLWLSSSLLITLNNYPEKQTILLESAHARAHRPLQHEELDRQRKNVLRHNVQAIDDRAGNWGITAENMEKSQHTDFNEDKTNESASVACSHVRL